jgi:DNA-binding NarL/FixJ family response regulator
MVTVLVVDDVPALRQHVVEMLKEVEPQVTVKEASNGAEAIQLVKAGPPDMVVMDIVMPGTNGIQAAQAIWADRPDLKILFWSQFHKESFVRELGKIIPDEAIHGYALKTEPEEKLKEAINSVLNENNSYIDPIVRGVEYNLKRGDGSLSAAEYETLIDLLLGLNDRAIALRQYISVRGVQNRISSLSQKLVKGADNYLKDTAGMELYNTRVRIVLEALKRGLVDVDDLVRQDTKLDDWLLTRFKFDRTQVL